MLENAKEFCKTHYSNYVPLAQNLNENELYSHVSNFSQHGTH